MRALPAGTVTFLFTDVDGSTRLLHELGAERYAEALAEHRRVLREAFTAHGGVEVDTQGDAFFVAFPTAPGALAAAEQALRSLEPGPIRVRMGLHTGTPHLSEEGYVGEDVHRAARIAAAGHGGQVLVSEATARLVDGDLTGLGAHRLKDIDERVQLFQLGAARFTPLKTLNNSNLPLPATPLLGRKKEFADVLRLLQVERVRMVSVTGPGGIGKTRFALEAAHELVEHFAHGVWFVDLSALRDPTLVVPTIGATLGAKGELAEYVADKRLLLVLDNFEQVVDAASELAGLLRRCANVQLLVTSREPLHLAGECAYPLRPLAESPAVQLLRERAEAADPDFDAPWETLSAIVERLDRLPLAIELAAARVKALGPDELLSRLEQRLPHLTSRARDLPERQRTLRGAIEWSHELLVEPEKQLFRRMAVFAGGCTLEAVERVCEAEVDTLESLVDKSLVRRERDRYVMLETIREYAATRLGATEEVVAVSDRHADHYASLAGALAARARDADELAVRTLADEHANLLAAMDRATARGDVTLGRALVAGLWFFWVMRGFAREGYERVEALLARADGEPSGELLALAGELARYTGRLERAIALKQRALMRYGQEGSEPEAVAATLTDLAETLVALGDLGRAEALGEEALAIRIAQGVPWAIAHARDALVRLELRRGNPCRAAELAEASLPAWRDAGAHSDVAQELWFAGAAWRRCGDAGRARARLREALHLAREIGDWSVAANAVDEVAALAAEHGAAELPLRLQRAASAWRARSGFALAADRVAGDTEGATTVADGGRASFASEDATEPLEAAVERALQFLG